jgi:hypothetical protein
MLIGKGHGQLSIPIVFQYGHQAIEAKPNLAN